MELPLCERLSAPTIGRVHGHRRHLHLTAVRDLTARSVRRALDIVVAGFALLLLAPLIVAIAIAVKLGDRSAPVLFRQHRAGLSGTPFEVLKFRTMVPGADSLKEALRARSSVGWPDFRLEGDPRVTRVGRFLRKSSLDELPQLVNVLRGDMSLVGPRPTSFTAETYQLWQTERLSFRPGLTGPWQVGGRRSMAFEERCRLEIRFFRHRSLRADLWILLKTIPAVLRRTGVA
jgi:lipopolysaccharide/colanic/teichoic acid biosynthesis glycosyltransferase